jgi:hypothetical protein
MSLGSFWRRFIDILPKDPRYVATVLSYEGSGVYRLQLPGSAVVTGRGAAGYSVASKVFLSGGVVQGPAPTLTVEVIDV